MRVNRNYEPTTTSLALTPVTALLHHNNM